MDLLPPFYQLMWYPCMIGGVYAVTWFMQNIMIPELKVDFWSYMLPGWGEPNGS